MTDEKKPKKANQTAEKPVEKKDEKKTHPDGSPVVYAGKPGGNDGMGARF